MLASFEAYPRVMKPPNDPSGILIMASIPLALLDSFICWWIFANLVQTTRTLRLRRYDIAPGNRISGQDVLLIERK